jgi:ribosomal protein S18 acetylase RimI-like enzyme
MEIARSSGPFVRTALEDDKSEIYHLLQIAPYRHIHVDWHTPADWIGTPGFVVSEVSDGQGISSIAACLAAAADPPPAAWIRLAAIKSGQKPLAILEIMLQKVMAYLRDSGVLELGWFPVQLWPEQWLMALGFKQVNRIVTFIKEGLEVPPLPENHFEIRQAHLSEMSDLAALEGEAFLPLWRHSEQGLRLAYGKAQSFEVAEKDGRIVGFQYSVEGKNRESVHLVRITVAKGFQNQGIGSALMASALDGFRRKGIRQVTLNTQIDNISSHRLYQRFGFNRLEDELPVWALEIGS